MKSENPNYTSVTTLKAVSPINKCLVPIVIVLFSICGCNHDNNSNTGNDLKDQIEFLVSGYHNEGKFDGTILVADSSEIIYKGAFGLSNHEKESPLSIESQFYLASVSKQYTASAILLLIQNGSIAPDDPIHPHLPELPDIIPWYYLPRPPESYQWDPRLLQFCAIVQRIYQFRCPT